MQYDCWFGFWVRLLLQIGVKLEAKHLKNVTAENLDTYFVEIGPQVQQELTLHLIFNRWETFTIQACD